MRSEKGPELSGNAELGDRFLQLCRATDEMLAEMPPGERDRMLQEHLAATRGPGRNFLLLCQISDELAALRRERMGRLRDRHE